MSGFAGVDRDVFPGLGTMQQLKSNTNLAWTGYYLTPAPSQGRQLWWTGNRASLVAQGWGLAPIYVDQQAPQHPCRQASLSARPDDCARRHRSIPGSQSGCRRRELYRAQLRATATAGGQQSVVATYLNRPGRIVAGRSRRNTPVHIQMSPQ